jgi:hypothetical protein
MPVGGVAQIGVTKNKDWLDKLAQGVGVANSIIEMPMGVAKFMQDRKIAKANLALSQEQAAEQQVNTDVTLGEKTEQATPEEMSAGTPDLIQTRRMGVRKIRPELKLSPFDQERLKDVYKDFIPALPGDEGAIEFTIGNERMLVRPKPGSEGGDRIVNTTQKHRQEYSKQSNTFDAQTEAYGRLVAAGTEPSAFGDLALIFNYMKILDPGSVVRESEFATAAATGSLDQRIQAYLQKLAVGERLTPEQRKDLMDRGARLYKSAENKHAGTVNYYTQLARELGLNPRHVVIPIHQKPLDYDAFQKEVSDLTNAFKQTGWKVKPPVIPPPSTSGEGVF